MSGRLVLLLVVGLYILNHGGETVSQVYRPQVIPEVRVRTKARISGGQRTRELYAPRPQLGSHHAPKSRLVRSNFQDRAL